ncbi:MAG: hypothetical protein AAF206_07630 [Bacteroidota bacterium]
MNDLSKIQAYLNGSLSPAEKAAVEERMRSDANFMAELSAEVALRSGRRMELEAAVQQIDFAEAPKLGRRRALTIAVSAAAAVILLWLLWRGLDVRSPQDRFFEQYFTPFPNLNSVLAPDQDAYDAAFALYDEKDFEAAIAAFGDLEGLNPVEQQEVAFYTAVSYLALRDVAEAKPMLARIRLEANNKYAAEAQYYLVLAHVLAGEWDDASALLRETVADARLSRKRLNEAKQLLADLDQMD